MSPSSTSAYRLMHPAAQPVRDDRLDERVGRRVERDRAPARDDEAQQRHGVGLREPDRRRARPRARGRRASRTRQRVRPLGRRGEPEPADHRAGAARRRGARRGPRRPGRGPRASAGPRMNWPEAKIVCAASRPRSSGDPRLAAQVADDLRQRAPRAPTPACGTWTRLISSRPMITGTKLMRVEHERPARADERDEDARRSPARRRAPS